MADDSVSRLFEVDDSMERCLEYQREIDARHQSRRRQSNRDTFFTWTVCRLLTSPRDTGIHYRVPSDMRKRVNACNNTECNTALFLQLSVSFIFCQTEYVRNWFRNISKILYNLSFPSLLTEVRISFRSIFHYGVICSQNLKLAYGLKLRAEIHSAQCVLPLNT
jgi:hypothetical protein